jgi:hypothetical protein
MPEHYSVKHSGACLVVGYAPDVHSDVARARAMRPEAPLLGVKYAASIFPDIQHVWTQHLEQSALIKARAMTPVYVHARQPSAQKRRGRAPAGFDLPELDWVAGSSGFAAGLWARHGMGFDEVILCGIPLDGKAYAAPVAAFKREFDEPGWTAALKHWRESIDAFMRKGLTAGIRSMSGWTRDVLGAPA